MSRFCCYEVSQADNSPPLSEGHHVTGRMKDVMGRRDASEIIQKDRKSGLNRAYSGLPVREVMTER